jgi:hypothetical protein
METVNLKNPAILLFSFALFFLLLSPGARSEPTEPGQDPKKTESRQDGMSGIDTCDRQRDSQNSAAAGANQAMSGHHMDMGAHMFMTELGAKKPGDDARAAQLVETLRSSIGRYKDYHVALDDGFQIFMPDTPQEHYHFTNYRYAIENSFEFNPAHPTSLLYKKTPTGYELEGAMYTAPKRFSEDQLDDRVPLSIARWHKHVNLCLPPKGLSRESANLKEFGFRGSIATADACQQAGGRWMPVIFGWMVHVYPYETDPQKIWAH